MIPGNRRPLNFKKSVEMEFGFFPFFAVFHLFIKWLDPLQALRLSEITHLFDCLKLIGWILLKGGGFYWRDENK
ncbi:hypothetical protein NJE56_01605 [Bacillus pumilus]|uniref:hypothetical protein n=1 Tax=Bacillus pumilus TaxID=1408 RepID=UPI0024C15737|nr:hypothetical protein [Bacillus pumilus]MDX5483640.1 hypothetical protein [Bacillus pumilus]WHX46305.1 hypothetical protein QNH35_07430 [Bacillus pumilus]